MYLSEVKDKNVVLKALNAELTRLLVVDKIGIAIYKAAYIRIKANKTLDLGFKKYLVAAVAGVDARLSCSINREDLSYKKMFRIAVWSDTCGLSYDNRFSIWFEDWENLLLDCIRYQSAGREDSAIDRCNNYINNIDSVIAGYNDLLNIVKAWPDKFGACPHSLSEIMPLIY